MRKALKNEITALRGFYPLLNAGKLTNVWPGSYPDTIYSSNSDQIGHLSDGEVENIVQYYSSVNAFENYVEIHRQYNANQSESRQILNGMIENIMGNKALALRSINSKLGEKFETITKPDWMSHRDLEIMFIILKLRKENQFHYPSQEDLLSNLLIEKSCLEGRLENLLENELVTQEKKGDEVGYNLTTVGLGFVSGEVPPHKLDHIQDRIARERMQMILTRNGITPPN